MYWWSYYPYSPYSWWYWVPPYPYDPVYLMNMLTQWMIYPYYYMLTLEIYRTLIDTWRKSLEGIIKSMEAIKTTGSK